jgi:hypothetical protein
MEEHYGVCRQKYGRVLFLKKFRPLRGEGATPVTAPFPHSTYRSGIEAFRLRFVPHLRLHASCLRFPFSHRSAHLDGTRAGRKPRKVSR